MTHLKGGEAKEEVEQGGREREKMLEKGSWGDEREKQRKSQEIGICGMCVRKRETERGNRKR